MRRKALIAAAAAAMIMFFCGFDFFGMFRPKAQGETGEHLFNMANEAMIKGSSNDAIQLYYKLIQEHPEFREYRADALYRLGTLLYKAERYEEAEKTLKMLAEKYGNYDGLRTVYEKLLYIYVRELKDKGRAQKIRQLYEKKFGKSQVLEDADKTERILNAPAAGESGILKLYPPDIGVTAVQESDSYDPEFFPVKCVISNVSAAPDRHITLERKKNSDRKYFLYVSGANKKAGRVTGTKNGFAPQWSWDDKYAAFTAMDWSARERHIKLYDVEKNMIRKLFNAPGVEPLTCISPDASLVAFWYQGGLWLVNRSGNSISLITNKVDGKGVFMMAWSREGGRILIGKKVNGRERYYTCVLGRKEFIIVK